jgi:hypothetical protein
MNDQYPITLEDAVQVCRLVEEAVKPLGAHCALTGGCLYRGGSSKDIDIIIYPHNPREKPSDDAIADALVKAGFVDRFVTDENYVNRIVWICGYKNMRIDFFMS